MSTPATGTLTITNAREMAAQALQPTDPSDPLVVLDNVVDTLDPPALMLVWDDPWLEPQGTCRWWARLGVLCVADRIEPAPGVADLEQLVSYAVRRLAADGYGWGNPNVTAPRRWTIARVDYLAALVTYRLPVTLNEED